MNGERRLTLADDPIEDHLRALHESLSAGRRRVLIRGANQEAKAFVARAREMARDVELLAPAGGAEHEAMPGLAALDALVAPDRIDLACLFLPDAAALSPALLELADVDSLHVVAPVTDHHPSRRPVFINSI